jgi:hypothetical protein
MGGVIRGRDIATAGDVCVRWTRSTVIRTVRSGMVLDAVIFGEIPAVGEHVGGIQVETSWTMALGRSALQRRVRRGVRGRAFRDGSVFNLFVRMDSRLELVGVRRSGCVVSGCDGGT